MGLLPDYYITLITLVSIYSIAALGLNITMGFAGQVNLGQAAFLGIGAMTSAILTVKFGFSFWIGLILGGIVSFLIGSVMGIISTRLREDFLAITTIAFNFLVVYLFEYYDFFGGSYGITGIPKPSLFGYTIKGEGYMVLTIVILIISLLFAYFLSKSWLGIGLNIVREDEMLAESISINVRLYKVLAFSIGAMLGGIAGVLSAHFKGYIVFSDFEFSYSIAILTMSILGGIDSIMGSVLGAGIVILAPEIFRPLMLYRRAMYGILIVLVIFFAPRGILGKRNVIQSIIAKIKSKPLR